jgi:hypothetical protein
VICYLSPPSNFVLESPLFHSFSLKSPGTRSVRRGRARGPGSDPSLVQEESARSPPSARRVASAPVAGLPPPPSSRRKGYRRALVGKTTAERASVEPRRSTACISGGRRRGARSRAAAAAEHTSGEVAGEKHATGRSPPPTSAWRLPPTSTSR